MAMDGAISSATRAFSLARYLRLPPNSREEKWKNIQNHSLHAPYIRYLHEISSPATLLFLSVRVCNRISLRQNHTKNKKTTWTEHDPAFETVALI